MFPMQAIWLKISRESEGYGFRMNSEFVPVQILAFSQETIGGKTTPVAIVLVDEQLRTLDLKDLSGVKLQ